MGSGVSRRSGRRSKPKEEAQEEAPTEASFAVKEAHGEPAQVSSKPVIDTAPSSKSLAASTPGGRASVSSVGSSKASSRFFEPRTPVAAAEDDDGSPRRVSLDYRSFLPERFEVDVAKRYSLDKLALGEGGYGQVFVAKDLESDRMVAVKKVTKTSDRERTEAFYSEVKLMKELDHPNICKLLETFEQGSNIFFVMEYCEGGELFERIVSDQFIDEEMSAGIIRQVAAALRYAHDKKIAHRDIKPENIVFCSTSMNDQSIKVIDWGLGICFADQVMRTAVGSFTYAAPEVVQCRGNNAYTKECDLWSLGVVTYIMLCGKPPFWGHQAAHLRRALAEEYPMSRPPWDKISEAAKDFVRKLLKAKPEERLPIDQVLAHPWLSATERVANTFEMESTLINLKQFSNSSRFQAFCVASVARQLDHRHLRRIHRVFREMDVEGDGVLTFNDVAYGFKRIFGEGSREYKEVEEVFHHMDLDGSGTIDYTEFCAAGMGKYATTQDDAVRAAFKSFDLDNSGALSKENLTKVLADAGVLKAWSEEVCQEVAQEMIDRYDANGSGAIEYDEWQEIMRQCWAERTLEDGRDDNGEQPDLLRNISTQSVTSTGSIRHTNNVVWAYDALSHMSGLCEEDKKGN